MTALMLAIAGSLRPVPKPAVTGNMPTLTVGTAISGDYGITATGFTVAPSASSTDLPAGVTLGAVVTNPTNYFVPVTGTPTAAGDFTAHITLTAGSQSATYTWSGTVAAAPASAPTVVQIYAGADGARSEVSIRSFPVAPSVGNTVLQLTLASGTTWYFNESTVAVTSESDNAYPFSAAQNDLVINAMAEISGAFKVRSVSSTEVTPGSDGSVVVPAQSAPAGGGIPIIMIGYLASSPRTPLLWPAPWTGTGPTQVAGVNYPSGGSGVAYAPARDSDTSAFTVTTDSTRSVSAVVVTGLWLCAEGAA